jgi:uncharacterized membrane protein
MEQKLALKIIMYISIAGLLFSGYLTFAELFQNTCPLGGCSYVLGAPACVYGFVMYLGLLVVSILGLKE